MGLNKGEHLSEFVGVCLCCLFYALGLFVFWVWVFWVFFFAYLC